MHRPVLRLALLAPLALVAGAPAEARGEGPPMGLEVLTAGYPRAFFFRQAENWPAQPGARFAEWDAAFGRLMGLEGKVLNEELPLGPKPLEFYRAFKARHPEKLVLLHYNGNARDPRDQTGAFFAGHWSYYNGAVIRQDLPASGDLSEIAVDRPELFRTNVGRTGDANEDVGLCELDAQGRPDWRAAEQVQLVSVDPRRRTITVRRGAYGTRPRAFRAGRSYAAAHVSEGPWGKGAHLLWEYNYATTCPRDSRGRACLDVLVADLAPHFAPGAPLEAFDGLEFDVMVGTKKGAGGGGAPGRGLDLDADGRIDEGLIGGEDAYGLGMVSFLRALRAAMGDRKLILADGWSEDHQRGFGALNGIESEGWPALTDPQISDWSGGLNRLTYWAATDRAPVLNYVNHKFVTPGVPPGPGRVSAVPMHVHRLVFAVAVMTDAAICTSDTPPPGPGERFGIWDELWMGREHRAGWLGQPEGPAVRFAQAAPDRLAGAGQPIGEALLGKLTGAGTKATGQGGALTVEAIDPAAREIRFTLRGVPCAGPDLFVSVTASATAPRTDPAGAMARLLHVGIEVPGSLVSERGTQVGMQRRGGPVGPLAADSGAYVKFTRGMELGGRRHDGFAVHPPYRGGTGMVYWQRRAHVPAGGVLEVATGMDHRAHGRSDGVAFEVDVARVAGGRAGAFRRVLRHVQAEPRWVDHRIPLGEFAGSEVVLRFTADAGPMDDPKADHARWGGARLTVAGEGPPSEPRTFMAWVGRSPTTSGFYFDGIRGKTVDLDFTIEGGGPATITKITAHAAPDVISRRFEHGLVLANPSPRPVALDLDAIAPGWTLRRLVGTPGQDPVTNDGSPTRGRLELGPRSGLFLVREPGP